MNRTIPAAILIFAFGACAEAPTDVTSDPPDPQLAATVNTIIHEVRIPFSNTQFWACVNEVVDFAGWFNVTVREVVSSSGNTQFRVHVNAQVKGQGQTTGDRYVSNSATNLTQRSNGAGFVSTFQFRINRISHGPGANSAGWIKAHMTFNANGELTASKFDIAFDVCRG